MALQQTGGLVEGGLVVVVAVDGVDELDVRVARGELGLHHLDPRVLVGRVRRSGQDRDLTSVTDLVGDHVDLHLGDAFGGGLVDEQVAALRGGVGVEGDDLHTGGLGFLQGVADGRLVVGRHDQRTHLLLRGGVDVGHLTRRVIALSLIHI